MFNKLFGKTQDKNHNISNVEKKGFNLPAGFIRNVSEKGQVSVKEALRFYREAAPVGTAIDWINDEFKSLDLILDMGGELTKDSPILQKLKRPNDDMTQRDFLETYGAYYLLANDVYLLATGAENREPAEIMVISPECATARRGSDGLTSVIELRTQDGGKEVFRRDDKQFRFFNAQRNREIWRVKGFASIENDTLSTFGSVSSNFGRSKLSSIKLEIEQYLAVAEHNLAKLNNGMRPGGIIKMPQGEDLSDDQYERIKEQVTSFYSGGANSGKTVILPGGLEFVPIASMSDMDFERLTSQVTKTVFTRYKIPLDLVTTDQAAANTAWAAKLTLYDNAVLPLTWRLLEELTNFLAPRYKLTENDVILPNENTIPALQSRRLEQIKQKSSLGTLTTNEIRKEIGYEDEVVGGDKLYIPNNLVPIGSTPVIQNNAIDATVVDDATKSHKCSHAKPMTRKSFVDLMLDEVDKNGNAKYTKEQLEKIADDEGLF